MLKKLLPQNCTFYSRLIDQEGKGGRGDYWMMDDKYECQIQGLNGFTAQALRQTLLCMEDKVNIDEITDNADVDEIRDDADIDEIPDYGDEAPVVTSTTELAPEEGSGFGTYADSVHPQVSTEIKTEYGTGENSCLDEDLSGLDVKPKIELENDADAIEFTNFEESELKIAQEEKQTIVVK